MYDKIYVKLSQATLRIRESISILHIDAYKQNDFVCW